jgi:hypothetical protein
MTRTDYNGTKPPAGPRTGMPPTFPPSTGGGSAFGSERGNGRTGVDAGSHWNSHQPLPCVLFEEISGPTEQPDFVGGLLCDGQMSVVYGEPGCGKSFLALSLGLAIARGEPILGRAVDQGGVVYVAAEGGDAVRRRIIAYKQAHGLEDSSPPFALVPETIDLCSKSGTDADRVIELVAVQAKRWEGRVRLIIIDTLSRAFGGGDENSSADMGSYVGNIDRIRNATGAHVLSVHHRGKNPASGARGHSSLRAAVDTEIEITNDEATKIKTVTVRKERDLACGDPLAFRLEVIELGTDRRGDPITSCVVRDVDPNSQPLPSSTNGSGRRLTDKQSNAIRELGNYFNETGQEWITPQRFDRLMIDRCVLDEKDNRARFTELRDQLKRRGLIVCRAGQFKVA